MASSTRTVWKVLSGCQRQLLRAAIPAYTGASQSAPNNLPVRTFTAVKTKKMFGKPKKEEKVVVKKEKKVIDNSDRYKPYGKAAWEPIDDVYIMKYYPRPVYGSMEAIDLLKLFQKLDFTPKNQSLYIDLRLNMKLEKKRKVEPFLTMVNLPYPFKTELNKVVVFTEDPDQIKLAQENGATFAGGQNLIEQVLNNNISADVYLAVPAMLQRIMPLGNKLRKKFPKVSKGSVSTDIVKMLDSFKMGHEVQVENECYIRTQIATLDMPTEQILANLKAVLTETRSHRPDDAEPIVERAIIASHTSEALWFDGEDLFPKPVEDDSE